MRCCAWLPGIDWHALHVSVCKQAGVACEVLLKVEPVRFRRLKFLVAGCITQSRLPVGTGVCVGAKKKIYIVGAIPGRASATQVCGTR
jgi:hypothetical protein